MFNKILSVLILLLPFAHLDAADVEQEGWDVNAIPGEAREVRIDTRSGSWMSLDVSPDGQSIAFRAGGKLKKRPAARTGITAAIQERSAHRGPI